MPASELTELLIDAARAFIAAIEERKIDQSSLIETQVLRWYEPTSSTSSQGRSETRTSLSHHSLRKVYEELQSDCVEPFSALQETASKFCQERGKFLAFIGSHFEKQAAQELLLIYFGRLGRLDVVEDVASELCQEFVNDLTADDVIVRSVYQVERFSATSEFQLADGITFRKMCKRDVEEFEIVLVPELRPHLDMRNWVCDYSFRLPKSNAQLSSMSERFEQMANALSLTCSGRSIFKHVRTGGVSPFLAFGHLRGGTTISTSGMGSDISLDEPAISAFQRRFCQVEEVLNKSTLKYLRLPLRRLRLSSERRNNEDRFVDLVIALESLLANDSDRLETTFRFQLEAQQFSPLRPTATLELASS